MAAHNELGQEGEKAAIAYLLSKGYSIRHTNWRCHHLELDIVAETPETLVVIEVKTRSTTYFQQPEDAVTDAKIRRIVNATQGYIRIFNIDKEVRFDVMALIPNGHGYSVQHFVDAFISPVW